MSDDTEVLLSSLTLEEKLSLIAGESQWRTASIERLGIPSLKVSPLIMNPCTGELTSGRVDVRWTLWSTWRDLRRGRSSRFSSLGREFGSNLGPGYSIRDCPVARR